MAVGSAEHSSCLADVTAQQLTHCVLWVRVYTRVTVYGHTVLHCATAWRWPWLIGALLLISVIITSDLRASYATLMSNIWLYTHLFETAACCTWQSLTVASIHRVSEKSRAYKPKCFLSSSIKLGRFWQNLADNIPNKFATEYYKYFPPHLNNVSTLYLWNFTPFCENPNTVF